MSDVDVVIAERLKLLANYAGELRALREQATTFDVYLDNMMLRRAVERTLQISVEACLDIGRRLISVEGFRYPEDNRDVFQVLRQEDVITEELLLTLIDMARFRNLVVHDYARIDDGKVYGILKRNLGDFDAYAEAIADYVVTAPSESEAKSDPST